MGVRLRLVAALAVLVAIWLPTLAFADAGMERQFTDLVHRERAAAGVPAYAEREDLADVARGQAERMASEQRLYHNPRLGDEVQNWDAVGENVGRGPSVEAIHQAFMDSPTHRSEILSTDFTEVGVGVAVAADGEIWVAQVFRRPSAPPAPAPQPAPTTTVAPAPPTTIAAPAAEPVPAPTTTTSSTTTSTTVAPLPPPAPPVAPEVLAATATQPAPAASSAAAPASARQIRATTGSGLDDGRLVSIPVRVAATMLVLVVAAQTTYVARVQLSSADARRQRSQASMNSSRSPSSTPWTLPVS